MEEHCRNHGPMRRRGRRSQVNHNDFTHRDEHLAAQDCDIIRYSMTLKKFCDLGHEPPRYTIRPTTSGPEGFVANSAFNGIRTRRSGRTKKIAQQQAAKVLALCFKSILGRRPPHSNWPQRVWKRSQGKCFGYVVILNLLVRHGISVMSISCYCKSKDVVCYHDVCWRASRL